MRIIYIDKIWGTIVEKCNNPFIFYKSPSPFFTFSNLSGVNIFIISKAKSWEYPVPLQVIRLSSIVIGEFEILQNFSVSSKKDWWTETVFPVIKSFLARA